MLVWMGSVRAAFEFLGRQTTILWPTAVRPHSNDGCFFRRRSVSPAAVQPDAVPHSPHVDSISLCVMGSCMLMIAIKVVCIFEP